MTQREFEKEFRERFGCNPLTDEELDELKAVLFDIGQGHRGMVVGNVNRFCRYQAQYEWRRQKEEAERQEEEDWNKLASFAH